jgi:hypothetical protein
LVSGRVKDGMLAMLLTHHRLRQYVVRGMAEYVDVICTSSQPRIASRQFQSFSQGERNAQMPAHIRLPLD